MHIVLGFSKPRQPILGAVFSGEVEKIGESVTKFKIGDEVYGTSKPIEVDTHIFCINIKTFISPLDTWYESIKFEKNKFKYPDVQV